MGNRLPDIKKLKDVLTGNEQGRLLAKNLFLKRVRGNGLLKDSEEDALWRAPNRKKAEEILRIVMIYHDSSTLEGFMEKTHLQFRQAIEILRRIPLLLGLASDQDERRNTASLILMVIKRQVARVNSLISCLVAMRDIAIEIESQLGFQPVALVKQIGAELDESIAEHNRIMKDMATEFELTAAEGLWLCPHPNLEIKGHLRNRFLQQKLEELFHGMQLIWNRSQ
ncbi:MAG TPA: hypothetical protein PLO78_06435 [Candidatus Omnitrophota bacterium]|nr:hypothetical protein [Candidatus Omnitrophota bacterium]